MIFNFSRGNIFPIFAVYRTSTQTGCHRFVNTNHGLTDMVSTALFFLSWNCYYFYLDVLKLRSYYNKIINCGLSFKTFYAEFYSRVVSGAPSGHAFERVHLRRRACWDFETHRGMEFCLLWVLCVVRQISPRRADHSARGVLPSVVSKCNREASTLRRPWPNRGCRTTKTKRVGGESIFMVAPCMLIISNPLFVQLMHTQIVLKLLNY